VDDTGSVTVVPGEQAMAICAELRRGSWLSYSRWWCWGCATFSKGDPAGMCGAVVACPQVLARYNKRLPHAGKDGG